MKTKPQNIKNLRYLSPEYEAEPNRFLKEIVVMWDINWSTHFGFLFSYSMCPQLDRNRDFEYGFTYLHLAQMIEAAHTILNVRNWLPTSKKKLFTYDDHLELYDCLERTKINAQRVISDFFGFMDLPEWYGFLDELLLSSDIKDKKTQDIAITQEHLIARELMVLLPDALLKLHQDITNLTNSQPSKS